MMSMPLSAGPDAPLALERGLSVTHMAHGYDFFRPSGLYPAVRAGCCGWLLRPPALRALTYTRAP